MIAYAIIKNGSAVIRNCPACGGKHQHSPEPGHRVAHCARDKAPIGGYEIVIISEESSLGQRPKRPVR